MLSQIIERHLATFSRPSTKRLIHGQLHTQNILSKKSGEICVIDFGESIGMSSPLQDLYVLLSSHDGWSKGTGNRAQREAILKGYGGIDAADVRELYYLEFSSYVKALRDYMTPDQICDAHLEISLFEVHAATSYCYANKQEIDAAIQVDKDFGEKLRKLRA